MSPTVIDIVLAGLNVDRGLRDALIGDLMEESAELAAAHGVRSANRWMRWQVIRSVPVLAHGTLRAGGPRLLVGVLAAAAAALALVMGLIGVSATAFGELLAPETVRRFGVLVLALDLAYGAAGGYLAARFGRSAPLASALAFGVLAVATSMVSTAEVEHSWYPLALQLLLVPATLGGGWVRARHLARRHDSCGA
jgi:hypothetical protein